MKIILSLILAFCSVASYGASQGVSFDSTTRNVAQTDLNLKVAKFTNTATTASTILGTDASKGQVSSTLTVTEANALHGVTVVPNTRSIATTSPITGGGDLSADRTFAIPAASDSVNGYLTSTDHAAFAAKQASFTTGIGLTNNSGTLSNNIVAGSNITITGGPNGQLSVASAAAGTNAQTCVIGITIDGGGSAITTGVKGYISIPYACTINSVTLLADQSGSSVVDIWKCTYTQFDAGSTHPVAGDKITASAPPTITTATKSQDTTLTGWTTAISANDVLAFSVTSDTTITRINLVLKVTK